MLSFFIKIIGKAVSSLTNGDGKPPSRILNKDAYAADLVPFHQVL